MGRQAPTGSVPDRDELPTGNWKFKIDELKEDPSNDGRLRYSCQLRALAPLENLVHFERFFIGTDDDPDATDPQTWTASFGFKQLVRMCRKAKVQSASAEVVDMDQLCSEASDHEFDGKVTSRLYTDKVTGEQRTAVGISGYYEAGSLQYGLIDMAPRQPKGAMPAVGQRPQAPTRPQAPAGRPAPAAPRAPQPPVQRTIARPPVRPQAPVAPNGEDVDGYEVPEEAPPPAASKRPGA